MTDAVSECIFLTNCLRADADVNSYPLPLRKLPFPIFMSRNLNKKIAWIK